MTTAPLPGLDLLYDTAPCGLLLADRDGVIVHANLTICHWLQYERAELLAGVRFASLLTVGGRIFHQTHLAPLLKMQGSVGEVKLDLRRKDSTPLTMMLNMTERAAGGQLLHVAAFLAEDRNRYERELLLARRQAESHAAVHARDQRDLAAAQWRLRLALEAANLYAWEVDPQTGQRKYEAGAARLLGYSGPFDLPAEAFQEAIDPADREREMEAFAAAMRGGSDTYRCTYRLIGRDRVVRTVMSAGRAFFDPSGRLEHFVGVLQEVADPAAS